MYDGRRRRQQRVASDPWRERDRMPEYLKFGVALSDLDLAEAEAQLQEQLELLQAALNRLQDSDRVRAEIFDSVVSV